MAGSTGHDKTDAEKRQALGKIINDASAAFLVTRRPGDGLHGRPMATAQVDDDITALWFACDKDSPKEAYGSGGGGGGGGGCGGQLGGAGLGGGGSLGLFFFNANVTGQSVVVRAGNGGRGGNGGQGGPGGSGGPAGPSQYDSDQGNASVGGVGGTGGPGGSGGHGGAGRGRLGLWPREKRRLDVERHLGHLVHDRHAGRGGHFTRSKRRRWRVGHHAHLLTPAAHRRAFRSADRSRSRRARESESARRTPGSATRWKPSRSATPSISARLAVRIATTIVAISGSDASRAPRPSSSATPPTNSVVATSGA